MLHRYAAPAIISTPGGPGAPNTITSRARARCRTPSSASSKQLTVPPGCHSSSVGPAVAASDPLAVLGCLPRRCRHSSICRGVPAPGGSPRDPNTHAVGASVMRCRGCSFCRPTRASASCGTASFLFCACSAACSGPRCSSSRRPSACCRSTAWSCSTAAAAACCFLAVAAVRSSSAAAALCSAAARFSLATRFSAVAR